MSPPGLRFGTIRRVATRGEFENLNTVGDELGFRERINLLLQPSPRLVAAQQMACQNLRPALFQDDHYGARMRAWSYGITSRP
jgi:hypothetical protein